MALLWRISCHCCCNRATIATLPVGFWPLCLHAAPPILSPKGVLRFLCTTCASSASAHCWSGTSRAYSLHLAVAVWWAAPRNPNFVISSVFEVISMMSFCMFFPGVPSVVVDKRRRLSEHPQAHFLNNRTMEVCHDVFIWLDYVDDGRLEVVEWCFNSFFDCKDSRCCCWCCVNAGFECRYLGRWKGWQQR